MLKPILWSPPPVPLPQRRPILFVDRDGVIIEDSHYLNDPADVRLLPGAAEGIVRIRRAGWHVVMLSNQSGLARGLISAGQFAAVQSRVDSALAEQGAYLDAAAYCPHGPRDGCPCRKPRSGMLDLLAEHLVWNATVSVMVGDKRSDLDLAVTAGLQPFLVRTGYGSVTEREGIPDGCRVADDLAEAVGILIEEGQA